MAFSPYKSSFNVFILFFWYLIVNIFRGELRPKKKKKVNFFSENDDIWERNAYIIIDVQSNAAVKR